MMNVLPLSLPRELIGEFVGLFSANTCQMARVHAGTPFTRVCADDLPANTLAMTSDAP